MLTCTSFLELLSKYAKALKKEDAEMLAEIVNEGEPEFPTD
jgi:hypothetical protein